MAGNAFFSLPFRGFLLNAVDFFSFNLKTKLRVQSPSSHD